MDFLYPSVHQFIKCHVPFSVQISVCVRRKDELCNKTTVYLIIVSLQSALKGYVKKTVPENNHFFFYARMCVEYHIYISENSTISVYQMAS